MKRFDAVGQKFVQKAVVEVEAFGVRRTGSFGKYPRPRDRKTIGLDAQLLYQANIFLVPVIVIVGAVRVAVIANLARRVGERIPDRASPAVFIDGALDLIGGGGGAPDKASGEAPQRGGQVAGFASRSSDFAGVAAIPSAEKPASFAKCRRENLPNMDFSRQNLLNPILPFRLKARYISRIDSSSGNPVDFELDGNYSFRQSST